MPEGPVLKARIDSSGAVTGARQFNKATSSMTSTVKKAALAIGGLVGGLTAVAQLTKAARTIAAYEKSMSTLRAVAVTANVELSKQAEVYAQLDAKAKELGATTKFSASEAADGLLFLARAGFTASEQLDAIGATLNLAIAGVMELGSAADLASNVVSQFGLAASDTERVVDAMVNTANRANTSVEQLGEAMKFAGPVAGALGIDVETAAAAVGVLGDSGIQASQAGTNLRGVMLALAGPTTDAKKAFAELGLTLDEVDPAKNNFIDIWDRFAEAFENLEDQTRKTTLANDIFGRRNVAASLILARSGARQKELVEIQKELRGATEDLAKEMADNLDGAFKNLRSAAEALTLELGEAGLSAAFRGVVDTATGVLRSLAGVQVGTEQATVAVTALTGAIRGVIVSLGILIGVKVVTWLAAVTTAITLKTVALIALNAQLGITAVATGVATAAWGRFLAIASKPLGIVGLLAAAGVALALFVRKQNEASLQAQKLREELEAQSKAVDELNKKYLEAINIQDYATAASALREELLNLKEAIDLVYATDQLQARDFQRIEALTGAQIGSARQRADFDQMALNQALGFDDSPDLTREQVLERLLDLQGRTKQELEGLRQQTIDQEKAENNLADAREENVAALEEQVRVYDEFILKLKAETEVVGLSNRQRKSVQLLSEGIVAVVKDETLAYSDKGEALLEVWRSLLAYNNALTQQEERERRAAAAMRGSLAVWEALGDAIDTVKDKVSSYWDGMSEAMREAIREQVREREEAKRNVEGMERDLDTRREQLGLNEQARQVQRSVAEFELEASRAKVEGAEAATAAYKKELEALIKLEEQDDLHKRMAQAFEDAATSMIMSAESVEDAIEGMMKTIAEMLVRQYVTRPLAEGLFGITGIGAQSARGNLFKNGETVPFASGGMIDDTVIFPMRNNRIGIAGERGPEVGARVTRMANGDAGIEVPERNVTVNMTVNASGDSKEWGRNARQMARALKRELGEV